MNHIPRIKNKLAFRKNFVILTNLSPRRSLVKDCDRPLTRGKSVKDDWRAWLPEAKAQVFDRQVQRLESSYVMLSVSLNEVLLSQRLQFLHKISTLEEMVEDLGKDYRHAADDLAEGMALNPKKMWDEVDSDHYDLNTCLREAIVVFKSFLIALPESQLVAFQDTVRQQSLPETGVPSPPRVIRPRRVTAIASE